MKKTGIFADKKLKDFLKRRVFQYKVVARLAKAPLEAKQNI